MGAEQRIGGRYQPVEVVGRGGEATVIKAVDMRHERLVALKVRGKTTDGQSEGMLLEARALLSLPPHPALAHARDDLFDDGRHVLVLDWVEGINLAQLLADEGNPGLPMSSVLRWAAQAAEALTVLHQHGVVHGDVKPANLILDNTGRIVLVDLGSSSVPVTSTARGGTPGFRAPEVAGGGSVTRASDVFSLAATVFALLTGGPPAGGLPEWNGIAQNVASRLEEGLRAGLAIDPARRPATPGELVERLRAGWDDETPTGAGTVLLTDVVGSTQLWERAPEKVPALLAEMQLIIDRAVEAHGGRRLGATVEGDATISLFPNAGNAMRAAVAMQQGLSGSDGVRVRAGLATGELVSIEGDILGPTVNRAARVRDLARAGEIVLSGSTAAVVRSALPAGVDLLDLGAHELRGIDGLDEVAAVVADGVATPPDPSRSPYPGLAPFGQDDADLFFGREETVERCLHLLGTNGFVALIGASGSGKTSMALAGIVPRLARAVVVRPGAQPMRELIECLLRESADCVLVVDQLEELITICRDTNEQVAFVDTINAHAGGVIATLRADLYGEFGVFDTFAERLAASQVLLGPLREADLTRAVQEPARRCGLDIEEGLAELIVAELGDAPGTLPLLGHALREAWLRREGRTITVAGYRASGGVRSAIAATAESALAALDDEETEVARRVLLRMVELRPDAEDTRRWASRQELIDVEPQHVTAVVDALVRARLLVVDHDQVTVTHEALLRAWPRLGEWIAEERAVLLLRQEVRWAAERWNDGGRTDADLYRGLRLDAALELAEHDRLPARETEFVEAGRVLRDHERADERRRTRRLRTLVGITSVLAAIALVGGGIAVVQRNQAQDARASADRSTREARIEALVGRAEAIRATQRDTSALLAVEASRLADTVRTRSTLLTTFTSGGGFLDTHRLRGHYGGTGIVSPDGKTAFVNGQIDNRLRPYDLDSGVVGESFSERDTAGDQFPVLAMSDNGNLLARAAYGTGEGSPTRLPQTNTVVQLYDTRTHTVRVPSFIVQRRVSAIAFTPDARRFALVAGDEARLLVYDTTSGALVAEAPGLPSSIAGGSVVASGDQFVVGSSDGSLRFFDAQTAALTRTVTRPQDTLTTLLPIGDGTVLAVGDRTATRIDLADGSARWENRGTTRCSRAAVVAQRGTFYCGDYYGRIAERDLANGAELRRLDTQTGNAGALWPARGGTELVSFSSNEGVVVRWRLDGSGPITRAMAPGWSTNAASPDSRYLLVERPGDTLALARAQVVEAATGRVVREIPGLSTPSWLDADTVAGAVLNSRGLPELAHVDLSDGRVVRDGFVFDPAPTEVLTGTGKRRALLRYGDGNSMRASTFDVASRHVGTPLYVTNFLTAAINRSGDRVAFGTWDGIRVYDGNSGRYVGGIHGSGRGVFITPSDQLFVSSYDGDLTQYDLATLKPVRSFGGRAGYVQRGSGTRDGSMVATTSGDQTVTLYDLATGVGLGTPLAIPDGEANNIALAPNGSWLAMGGGARRGPSNAPVTLWDLDRDHLVDAACRVAGRNLTREEWDELIGDLVPYHATCSQFPRGK